MDTDLESYLKEIAGYPMLTAEEETRLARRGQEGDQAAIDALVRPNLRFVVRVAETFLDRGFSFSDLIDEGNLALIQAAHEFDWTGRQRFIPFAVRRVREAILETVGGDEPRDPAREHRPGQPVSGPGRDGSAGLEPLQDFGLEILSGMDPHRNAVVSPLSIGLALAMLYEGATGRSEDELRLAFRGAEPRELREAVRSFSESYPFTRGPDIELDVACALFTAWGIDLDDAYRTRLVSAYRATVEALDMAEPPEAASRVNQWVFRRTGGRIPSLVSPATLTPLTRIILGTAVHFVGRWREPFDPRETRPRPFFLEDGGEVQVPMMARTGRVATVQDRRFRAAVLPYASSARLGADDADLFMVVMLPERKRRREVEHDLSTQEVRSIVREAAPSRVALRLPRMEGSTRRDLKDRIQNAGVPSIFDRRDAGLGGMVDSAESLSVGAVLHGTRVVVDEAGTEASAATVAPVAALGRAVDPESARPFVVDRPHLVMVYSRWNDAVLFAARVMDPRPSA